MFGTFLGLLSAAVERPARDYGLLAQCAALLLNSSNPFRTATYVTTSPGVSADFRTSLLLAMHRTLNPPLLLNEFDFDPFNPNRYVLPQAYVVAARDATDLADYLAAINVTDDSWQPSVNFVLVLETPPEEASARELGAVFHRLWINYMFRSVLLVPPTTEEAVDGGMVSALVWYPFRRRCGEYHAPKAADTCGRPSRQPGSAVRWTVRGDLFGDRIPDAFHECTVTIAAFDWPPMTVLRPNGTPPALANGMDVEVVKLMSRIGNVKLAVNEIGDNQRWGVKSANGTWDGGFGELSRHRADFLIGGGIMTAERMEMFDSAPPRQVIRFPIYTPLPRKLPYWRNMLNVFSGRFWLTLYAAFVLTAAVLWAAGARLPSERRAFADPGHCLMVSWSILCSVATGRQPTSVSSKLTFLSWVVYVLHISAVYTSMQLIYLYKPKYERPMLTVDDVKASGLAVCCVPTFIPIAHAMSRENFNLTEYEPCADMAESADRLLRQKDVIILDPEDHFEALVPNSAKRVNKARDVVIVHNIGIYMQKGNPYNGILARAQITAYETGLHNKWRQDASPRQPPKKEKNIKVKKLNIDELQGAFIILICGHCASAVAFVVELFWTRAETIE